MPRFFFHVRHGPGPDGLAVDTEGEELAGVEQVRDRALNVAQDLIARTRLHSIPDWFVCEFEVTDEDGQSVMTVPFSDTVTDEPDEACVR